MECQRNIGKHIRSFVIQKNRAKQNSDLFVWPTRLSSAHSIVLIHPHSHLRQYDHVIYYYYYYYCTFRQSSRGRSWPWSRRAWCGCSGLHRPGSPWRSSRPWRATPPGRSSPVCAAGLAAAAGTARPTQPPSMDRLVTSSKRKRKWKMPDSSFGLIYLT